jgi:tripartite-type tricarboxylate transporter receptor subunit TctC
MAITAWFALYAPAGLPADVLGKLERAVGQAIRAPDMRERLLKLGYQPVGSTGTELAAAMRTDLASWEKPIKSTGIALD